MNNGIRAKTHTRTQESVFIEKYFNENELKIYIYIYEWM